MFFSTGALAMDVQKEYQLKAAFIYNFMKLIDFGGVPSLTLCVVGNNPFNGALEASSKKGLQGKPISVKKNVGYDALTSCNVVFISQSESGKVSFILSKLSDAAILTVSDIDNFTKSGGIIGFIYKNNKIGIEVNATQAKKKQLHISAKLIEFATAVY